MSQQRSSSLVSRSQSLSFAVLLATLLSCLVLGLGQAFLISFNPLFGIIGVAAIVLIVLLFTRTDLALPVYILLAGPSIIISASNAGFLSRLYIGDLLFALLVVIWLLREISSRSKRESSARQEIPVLIPLVCLAGVGLVSIVHSHLAPDPHVTYAFVHSDIPYILVNIVEMFLLIGLCLFIVIVPAMTRTFRDARRLIGAYLLIGLPYALGTIFASPLHLISQQVILGLQRPVVFGSTSSDLGILNVLFACLAFGQMLYAKNGGTRLGMGLLACIFAGGVVMAYGRESWIGLFIAVWVILWFRFKSPIALFLPLVILPLLLLFFPDIINFFDPTKVYGADRINIWQDAIAIWHTSPYLGVGAGNFQFFDLTYGTDVAGVAHNQFLEVMAEMGVQGLICLLLVILMIGRAALKGFNQAVSAMGKAIALAYLGFFAALLFATFFTDSFVPSTAAAGGTGPFIEMSYLWLFLGLVLSVPNWDREAAIAGK